MSQSWQETFRELQAQFVRGSGERLDAIARDLDHLERSPSDTAALRDLRGRFHGLSGSGGTFGFPEVSVLGLKGEQGCDELFDARRDPDAGEIAAWRQLLQSLRVSLSATTSSFTMSDALVEKLLPQAAQVLVADEDPEFRDMISRHLMREGLSVVAVSTRAEALAHLEKRLPNGLVTDQRFSDGSGSQLVESLRSLPGGDAVSVVVVSSMAGFLDKVEAIHCGADAWFEKPVDWEALNRRLHFLLDRTKTEPPRILSVDDDLDQTNYVRAVLKSAGYEVRVCNEPERFEADTITFRPDLVLIDINLPGVSGYDLVRYIRHDERYATLPVIFLTTEARDQAKIQALKAGGDDHIVKPVSPALLLSIVAARLERAQFLKSLLGRDGLTGLLTHTAFLERARGVASRRHRSSGKRAALVLLDLDHFKAVNDQYGHPVGDKVLASLSALLRRRLRQSDTIGRLGGEEFAVILEDLSEDEALRLVRRLLEEFAVLPHDATNGGVFRVTLSAGISFFNTGTMNLETWRQVADQALYDAKSSGRNRVVLATAASA